MTAAIVAAYAAISVAIPAVWDRRHPPIRRRPAASTTGAMRRRSRV